MDEQSTKAVKDLAKLIAAAAIATVWLPAYPLGDKRPEDQPERFPHPGDQFARFIPDFHVELGQDLLPCGRLLLDFPDSFFRQGKRGRDRPAPG